MPKARPPIPSRDTLRSSEHLSIKPLLAEVRKSFANIPDHRTGKTEYSLVDTLMSASAVFGLKFPSLLKFDENRYETHIRHNLATLYGVTGEAPCDTQMRAILDPVEPAQISRGFEAIHRVLLREGILEQYNYLNRTVILLDGTGEYSSNCVGCPDCCTRTHADGTVEYYHQMRCPEPAEGVAAVIAHPDKRTVLPLATEPIIKQQDASKNDCDLC